MRRPTIPLPVTLLAEDVLAARKAGMLPASVLTAVWRAVEKVGPLELHGAAQEVAEYREWRDGENARERERARKRG